MEKDGTAKCVGIYLTSTYNYVIHIYISKLDFH